MEEKKRFNRDFDKTFTRQGNNMKILNQGPIFIKSLIGLVQVPVENMN